MIIIMIILTETHWKIDWSRQFQNQNENSIHSSHSLGVFFAAQHGFSIRYTPRHSLALIHLLVIQYQSLSQWPLTESGMFTNHDTS